jgi:V8-like Glu-specific endopeptidase
LRNIVCILTLLSGLNSVAIDKVVYGVDNRVDVDKTGTFWKSKASAVASMLKNSKLKPTDNGFKALSYMTLGEQFSLCKDERFYSQPILSDCSGFLISEDTLVTAGHCLKAMPYPYSGNAQKVCEDYSWAFDYTQTIAKDKHVTFSQVYRCKEVIKAEYSFANDFAILKLEKKVSGATPIKLAKEVTEDMALTVIGHPSGLPKKVAPGGKILELNPKRSKFYASLDTFQGNSGSPVLNKKGEAVGILVSGKTDYRYDEEDKCQRVNVCNNEGKQCLYDYDYVKGEGVTNIKVILDNFDTE